MQRKMMGSLKQHLIHSKYEKNKSAGADLDDVSNKSTPKLKAEPGTVIKVTLEGPVTSLTTAKVCITYMMSKMSGLPVISFVKSD